MRLRLPWIMPPFASILAMPTLGLAAIVVAACTPASPSTTPAPAADARRLAGPRPPLPGAPTGTTAFVNVGVVPMDQERVLANQTVLVEGGWITALGPASEVRVPATATRIDGRGKYLIPGLTECHSHINGQDTVQSALLLARMVASGVTSVRLMDPNSADGRLALAWRPRAAAGSLLSPRIYASGQWRQTDTIGPTRPEEVPALIAAYKAAGYDHIKYHWDKDMDTRTPQGRAVWDSVATAARRAGVPLVGHQPVGPGWDSTDAKAMRSLEHAAVFSGSVRSALMQEPPDYAAITARIKARATALKQAGVWFCPTLMGETGTGALSSLSGDAYKTAWLYRTILKTAHDAGIGLLIGTDMGVAQVQTPEGVRESIDKEFQGFIVSGLTPYQALVAGTRNAAEYFGTADSTGTVAVSKRADLALLNGNPLEDIRHTTRPAGMMLGGRWLPREELDRRTAALQGVRRP